MCCLGRQLQHRAVEADIADLELRGVHADREPAGAGIDVVARKGALRGAVELAPLVERQRVRGDNRPAAQDGQDVGRQLVPVQSTHLQPLAEMPHASSGPARAMMRLPSSTAGAVPRSIRMKLLGAEAPRDCSHCLIVRVLVRHVQDRGAVDRGKRPAQQRQADGLVLGHDRPDVGRTMAVAAEAVAGEAAVATLGHEAKRGARRSRFSSTAPRSSPLRWRS